MDSFYIWIAHLTHSIESNCFYKILTKQPSNYKVKFRNNRWTQPFYITPIAWGCRRWKAKITWTIQNFELEAIFPSEEFLTNSENYATLPNPTGRRLRSCKSRTLNNVFFNIESFIYMELKYIIKLEKNSQ